MRVVMPCGGLYRRYPRNGMPKYLRPMNDMRPMLSWSLDSVRRQTRKQDPNLGVFVAVRREDELEWGASEIIRRYEPGANVMVLPVETQGPADTVMQALHHFELHGPFLVKDGDCYWKAIDPWDTTANAVAVGWRETAVGDRGTKSWVALREDEDRPGEDLVTWIEEKHMPTDWYCCGGYQFADAGHFMAKAAALIAESDREVYCSHVIQQMILDGRVFRSIKCRELHDWGTWEKYVEWRRERKVYLFDLDGVLTTAGGPYGKILWKDVTALPGVADKLRELKAQGCAVCILTARPELVVEETEQMLRSQGIEYDRIMFGVPNGPRVVVNDYAPSNPYPSVEAVNTKRDSGDWMEMLDVHK